MELEAPNRTHCTERFALRIQPTLLRKVEAKAAQRGEPVSMFVRNALRRELEAA